ncbi:homeodomain super, partial [Coemansia erecta]
HNCNKGQKQQQQQQQSPKPSSRGYDSHINTVLYEWLSENVDHPFPSQADKNELMDRTGLTKMQLKNWLCNVRRRKLPHIARSSRKTRKSRR